MPFTAPYNFAQQIPFNGLGPYNVRVNPTQQANTATVRATETAIEVTSAETLRNRPFYFDLGNASIVSSAQSVPSSLANHLFSPDSLAYSVKNANPTTHLTPSQWATIVGTINDPEAKVEQLFGELWTELEVAIAEKQTKCETDIILLKSKIDGCDRRLAEIKTDLHEIRSKNRNYRNNLDLVRIVDDLEVEAAGLKKEKGSAKYDLKRVERTNREWPTAESFNQFLRDLTEVDDVVSTLSILKLVDSKFSEGGRQSFIEASDQLLTTNCVDWQTAAEIESLLDHIRHSDQLRDFTPPYEYRRLTFPGYEKISGDCVETCIRNFLKLTAEARPSGKSSEEWFEDLEMGHLKPLIGSLSGPDSYEKHIEFINLLSSLPDYHPDRRSDQGCIKAGHTISELTNLLKRSPIEIVEQTGAFREVTTSPYTGDMSLTTYDGSHYLFSEEVEGRHAHAKWTYSAGNKEKIPLFLSEISDSAIVDQVSNLLMFHYGEATLQQALTHFLRDTDLSEAVHALRYWPVATEQLGSSVVPHPALLLAKEDHAGIARLDPIESSNWCINDFAAAMTLVKESPDPAVALINIVGVSRCAEDFDSIFQDEALTQIFLQAADSSATFRSQFWGLNSNRDIQFVRQMCESLYAPGMAVETLADHLMSRYVEGLSLDQSQLENGAQIRDLINRYCSECARHYVDRRSAPVNWNRCEPIGLRSLRNRPHHGRERIDLGAIRPGGLLNRITPVDNPPARRGLLENIHTVPNF